MKRQRRSQLLLSLVLFVFIYLYVDIYQTSTAIKYLIIGASSGGIAFILFNKKVSTLRKGVFVSVIMLLILILPFLKEKKPVITRENRLLEGLWSTDSSGGYSIRIRIQDDSAFVSQSNKNIETGYGLHATQDSILLHNMSTNKKYIWGYRVIDSLHILLMNNEDELLLSKAME